MTKGINLGILETKEFGIDADITEYNKDRQPEYDEELEQAAKLFAQIIYDNWIAQLSGENETYQTISRAA